MLASDLGLALHPRARAVVFPALGAYVGGDIVSGMLATGMDRDKRVRLFIDVGTNCEIVLSDGDTIVSTAAPAGPGLRGRRDPLRHAGRRRRRRGGPDRPRRRGRRASLQVIGDVEPQGLCGSGLVDAVSELVRAGLLDATGPVRHRRAGRRDRPARRRPADRDRPGAGLRAAPARSRTRPPEETVYLSQRDVRELQFAKGAIATGWTLLLEELGLEQSDVQQVLLAGSFGSYLSPAAAVRIGLVPQDPGAADRLGRQRRRRGREDEPAERARARRRPGRCWRR